MKIHSAILEMLHARRGVDRLRNFNSAPRDVNTPKNEVIICNKTNQNPIKIKIKNCYTLH
jgi:hypothetical protein